MKLLIISNGHGEDLVGATLAKNLGNLRLNVSVPEFAGSDLEISVLPIVGEGKAYQKLDCKVLGPRKKLPSGGFSLRNLSYLWKDLKNGFLRQTWQFYKILRSAKPDLVIGIGDIVPIICAKITKAPFIFIGVNKTYYYKWFGYSYTPWEIWLLKSAKKVYARDQLTTDTLFKKGIKAEFVGNPLIDILKIINYKLQITNKSQKSIGLLPGTRESDLETNIEDFKKIADEIKKQDNSIEFIIAKKENFEEVLAQSSVIIGLSGTGNEQAAGLGIPVVSFPGQGSQYTKKFGEAQTQLLGKALDFIPERNFKEVAQTVLKILNNSELRGEMGKTGKERMGGAGAIQKITNYILQQNV